MAEPQTTSVSPKTPDNVIEIIQPTEKPRTNLFGDVELTLNRMEIKSPSVSDASKDPSKQMRYLNYIYVRKNIDDGKRTFGIVLQGKAVDESGNKTNELVTALDKINGIFKANKVNDFVGKDVGIEYNNSRQVTVNYETSKEHLKDILRLTGRIKRSFLPAEVLEFTHALPPKSTAEIQIMSSPKPFLDRIKAGVDYARGIK